MNIDEEFKQIISDIEFVISNKKNMSVQQVGTNILNSLTPKHFDTISEIYKKYPELENLDEICSNIEIMSDNEIWPTAIDEIVKIFEEIKQKYNL